MLSVGEGGGVFDRQYTVKIENGYKQVACIFIVSLEVSISVTV